MDRQRSDLSNLSLFYATILSAVYSTDSYKLLKIYRMTNFHYLHSKWNRFLRQHCDYVTLWVMNKNFKLKLLTFSFRKIYANGNSKSNNDPNTTIDPHIRTQIEQIVEHSTVEVFIFGFRSNIHFKHLNLNNEIYILSMVAKWKEQQMIPLTCVLVVCVYINNRA